MGHRAAPGATAACALPWQILVNPFRFSIPRCYHEREARRKGQGLRREHRRPRGWTRWYREGLLEAEPVSGVRLRTTLWGMPGA